MEFTETPLRRVNEYHGVIVNVTMDMVKLTDGHITLREVVEHPGGVCVAAVDSDGQVYLVRQYRYCFQSMLTELPAGKLEDSEDPLEAAKRELGEETGLAADTWQALGAVLPSPGIITEKLYIYLATDLHQGQAHPDPGEFVDVVKMPLSELLAQVESGEIADAKTVIGALRAARILGV